MIDFIIIENNLKYENEYRKIIDSIMFKNNIPYEINSFSKYNEELQKLINNTINSKIYLTEIDLNDNISGIDIAKEVRKKDSNSEIIFITEHDRMFETVYRSINKVFSFIEKFHDMPTRLYNDLSNIIDQNYDKKKLIFNNRKEYMQIYLKDILYIYSETHERKTAIVTKNNKYLVNIPLKDILTKCDNRFKQIHRACIVNTDEVLIYNWNEGYFKLKNNVVVNLCSKTYKNNIE